MLGLDEATAASLRVLSEYVEQIKLIPVLDERTRQIEADVAAIKRCLEGNGEGGVKVALALLKQKVATKEEHARTRRQAWLAIGLALIGIAGSILQAVIMARLTSP